MNILFLRQPSDQIYHYITRGCSDLEDVEFLIADQTDLEKQYIDADLIIGWRPDFSLLDKAHNLKLFINPGAGIQHLIQPFREINRKRKLALVNGHGNAYFTAQHIVALLLSLTNKILEHHNWMKAGVWRTGDNESKSLPIRYRNIGLVGYGSVNQYVHQFIRGFGATIHVLKNRIVENPDAGVKFYTSNQREDFYRNIDTLLIAVPLTSKTTNMISEHELNLLGKDGLLINAARGPVVNETALYNALKDKTISAAAIDVWYDYNPEPDKEGKKYPSNYPFHELDNVILSPHRAYSPFGDLSRWDEVIDNIHRVYNKQTPYRNEVSLEREY